MLAHMVDLSPARAPALPPGEPPELATLFAALADRTRLRIVALLRNLELAVGELAQVLEQSQPRISRHVRILAEAGLVERRKEGSWVFLRLARSPLVEKLIAAADATVRTPGELRTMAHDRSRLEAVQAERAAAAARYFADHAEEWDAIRSLHVADELVEAAMLRLMHNRRLGHVLDVGTGTGRMLEIFGSAARQLSAIDRSPEMLRIARAKLAALASPVDLRQADFYDLPQADGSVDTVILHQVLHFAQQPERVIAEAARVLGEGGHLLIADFASHSVEELRTRAAHARLGFSDAQVRGWFASNRLQLEAADGLAASGSDADGERLTVRIWLGRRRSLSGRPTEPTTERTVP